jgi:hypothetical protein
VHLDWHRLRPVQETNVVKVVIPPDTVREIQTEAASSSRDSACSQVAWHGWSA